MASILLTGGLGYIGSHTALCLLKAGINVIIVDNLANSKEDALKKIESISSRKVIFYKGDIRDNILLSGIFSRHKISAVFHLAGLKSVTNSQIDPIEYYINNVSGSINLLREMEAAGINKLIFSSSATVYGAPDTPQYSENFPTNPINVYGETKLIVEKIIKSISLSNPLFRAVILRYFNPVGAHASGIIGEDPLGIPNNLMPYIGQVALGKLPFLKIYGNDYDTPDGTGMRDYIHVEDLASGHLLALDYLEKNNDILTVNLGNEKPYSVLEVVKTFEKVNGIQIPYRFVERRSGDLAIYYAKSELSKTKLGWNGKFGLEEMCKDSWRFYQNSVETF